LQFPIRLGLPPELDIDHVQPTTAKVIHDATTHAGAIDEHPRHAMRVAERHNLVLKPVERDVPERQGRMLRASMPLRA
jgi:hypothetical protein